MMKEFLGSPKARQLMTQVQPESPAELLAQTFQAVFSQLPPRSEHKKPLLANVLRNMNGPFEKGLIQSSEVAQLLGVTPTLVRQAKQVASKITSAKSDLFMSSKISHSKQQEPFLQKVVEQHIKLRGGHKSGAGTLTYLISMKKEALYLDFRAVSYTHLTLPTILRV